jgi:hypothetical protein
LTEAHEPPATIADYYRIKRQLDEEQRATSGPARMTDAATEPVAADDPATQARAALAAEQERAELVDAARALVRKKGAEQGYAIDTDELSPEEALEAAGITPRELTRREQQIAQREAEYRRDPAAFERKQEVDQFESQWWSLSEGQRRERAAELGLNYEACKTLKTEEMQRRFP